MSRTRLSRAITSLIRHRDRRTGLPPVVLSTPIGASDGIAYQMAYEEEEDPNPTPAEVFLESGLVQMNVGPVAADIYYRAGMIGQTPPYLDTLELPDPYTWTVRPYIAGMDSITYPAGHTDHFDVLYNQWPQSGKLMKFARCQLGSGETQAFKSILQSPPSWALTYGLQTDSSGNYWLIKLRRATSDADTIVSRALITFTDDGDLLHADLKTASGGTIDRWSPADEVLRKLEGYVFACARGIGSWTVIGTLSISGLPIYYGFAFDFGGNNAAIVTTEQEFDGPDLQGLRNRLYTVAFTDVSAILTEQESELGTPGIEDIAVWYPDQSTTPSRMVAWFPKGLTQEWADIDSDMPFYAFYLNDDSLCEVWFKHDADIHMPEVNYINYTDGLPRACGGSGVNANERFSTHPDGGDRYANGFYLKNSPGQGIDLFTEAVGGTEIYDLNWTSAGGGGGVACLDHTLSGPGELIAHDCTGSTPPVGEWSKCCGQHVQAGITCGDAHFSRDYYASRTHLIGSIMMFNFSKADSIRLVKRFYEGWSGHTNVIRNWPDVVLEWQTGLSGTGKQGYPWGSWTGALFPSLFTAKRHCAQYPLGSDPSCTNHNPVEGAATSTGKPASGISIAIEDYLVTDREVVELLNATYDNWFDTGGYENLAEPPFGHPYHEGKIFCMMGIEGHYFTSPALNSTEISITNTALSPNIAESALLLGLF